MEGCEQSRQILPDPSGIPQKQLGKWVPEGQTPSPAPMLQDSKVQSLPGGTWIFQAQDSPSSFGECNPKPEHSKAISPSN